MSNVSEWSVTAGLNNSSPPDGWPEGMARSAVNDTAREMMAALAKWYKDMSGSLVTATSTTAYTLTTNSVYTSLSDISLLVFRAHAANTGTTTLQVDGLSAKPWRKDSSLANYASGEIALGQLLVVGYNSVEDDFFTVGPVSDSGISAGTAMVFYQASVPTGWTAVAQNNKALRVVTSGTTGGSAGGTTAFTSVFTSRTLTSANIPSLSITDTYTLPAHSHPDTFTLPAHSHPDTFSIDDDGSHSHNAGNDQSCNLGGGGGVANFRTIAEGVVDTSDAGTHDHGLSGSVSNNTSFPAISGSVSNNTSFPAISGSASYTNASQTAVDFAVQYIDVCVGTKN